LVVAEMTDLDILSEIFVTPIVMSKTQMILAGIDQFLSYLYYKYNGKNCQTSFPTEVERFSELVPDLT
jgi:hypothetical protein